MSKKVRFSNDTVALILLLMVAVLTTSLSIYGTVQLERTKQLRREARLDRLWEMEETLKDGQI